MGLIHDCTSKLIQTGEIFMVVCLMVLGNCSWSSHVVTLQSAVRI